MNNPDTPTVQGSAAQDAPHLPERAERALALMRAAGFDAAQAGASRTVQDEINIAHNQPSLLRSTEQRRLALTGLVDGRKASTELTDLSDPGLRRGVALLREAALAAPQDEANALSGGQRVHIVQGPLVADVDLLARATEQLLEYRARVAPSMMLDEAFVAHTLRETVTLTSGGSRLDSQLGWYAASVFGTASEGGRTSSFNVAEGQTHHLGAQPLPELFGIASMLRDTPRQVNAAALGQRFQGDVVFAPLAVADLVAWLLAQIGDTHLVAGTSLYRQRVGQAVASPLLTLASRFNAPGVAAVSADAFAAPAVSPLQAGVLRTLVPSLYASRKTGTPHVPTAPAGWELAAGSTPLAELVASVPRGALVGRLSMGNPAANGDFSAVAKNSFRIDGGALGGALSETMITGNVAELLRQVVAVSRERVDTGAWCLPWLRVSGLYFS
jgi:PmbA protein